MTIEELTKPEKLDKYVHTCRNGEKIKLKNMTDHHLKCTISMLNRNNKEQFDGSVEGVKRLWRSNALITIYQAEQERRKARVSERRQ